MTSSSSAATDVDAEVWYVISGVSVRIPLPNSSVYYFPQGHFEQYGLSEAGNLDTSLQRPFIHCRVISVRLFYHPLTEQPFARILLQPETDTWRLQSSIKDAGEDQDGANGNVVVSYTKVLTPSDANNGGGFSIPKSCADLVFPRLDFKADPPVQNLRMRDTGGNAWEFRHIYRGTPRRHLLTTGWSKFVNAKRLVAGDSVVFMRRRSSASDHLPELFVGIRRAENFGGSSGSWMSDESTASSALAEMEKAGKGLQFEVVYFPTVGSPDFVVEAGRVEEAWRVRWSAGMRVKMDVETGDSTPMALSMGTITAASLPESGSPWRMLQVIRDEKELSSTVDKVSPWEVKHVPPGPHLLTEFRRAKKLKAWPEPDADSIDGYDNYPSQTFSQLLAGCIEPEEKAGPDLLYRHSRNSSRSNCWGPTPGLSSFRLFGRTIRMVEPVERSSGGSKFSSCEEFFGCTS